MKKVSILLLFFIGFLYPYECMGQNSSSNKKYTFKRGDKNGIGKWYMGREIAHVMGFQGIGWLERSEREKEEDVSTLIQNMKIKSDETLSLIHI